MNRRAFLFAPLSLFGCASLPAANGQAVDVPKFGRFTSPPKSGRVEVDVQFHTPGEVTDLCRRISQWPETVKGAPACVTDRFTPGRFHLHVATPESWDDLAVMIQIGHEILHRLGAEHR